MPTKFRKDELIQALSQLNDEDYVCPVCDLPELIEAKGDLSKVCVSDKKADFCWCNRDD